MDPIDEKAALAARESVIDSIRELGLSFSPIWRLAEGMPLEDVWESLPDHLREEWRKVVREGL